MKHTFHRFGLWPLLALELSGCASQLTQFGTNSRTDVLAAPPFY